MCKCVDHRIPNLSCNFVIMRRFSSNCVQEKREHRILLSPYLQTFKVPNISNFLQFQQQSKAEEAKVEVEEAEEEAEEEEKLVLSRDKENRSMDR